MGGIEILYGVAGVAWQALRGDVMLIVCNSKPQPWRKKEGVLQRGGSDSISRAVVSSAVHAVCLLCCVRYEHVACSFSWGA